MAVVIRYFSTTGAGDEDGTTWANRAPLIVSNNWSSIITGFDFSGSDSLEVRIQGGLEYEFTQTFQASIFTVAAPSETTNPIFLVGCDDAGNRLPIPRGWSAAQPPWWEASLPVLRITTNTAAIICAATFAFTCSMLSWVTSTRNGYLVNGGDSTLGQWCVIRNEASNASAAGVTGGRWVNCVIEASGTAFDYLYAAAGSYALFDNNRLRATGSASSGNRRGFVAASYIYVNPTRCLITGCAGGGFVSTSTQTGQYGQAARCVIADNPGDGILLATTASQAAAYQFADCLITGNGGYGLKRESSLVVTARNRFRDNTSGATDSANLNLDDTSAGSDGAEYVNAEAGDYRIKYGSPYWGTGIGAGDEPAPVLPRTRILRSL